MNSHFSYARPLKLAALDLSIATLVMLHAIDTWSKVLLLRRASSSQEDGLFKKMVSRPGLEVPALVCLGFKGLMQMIVSASNL